MSRYLNCDKPFHKAMEQCKDVLFRPLIENYEYYYAENKLYVIRDKRSSAIFLSYGKSPLHALYRIEDLNLRETITKDLQSWIDGTVCWDD